MLLSFSSPFEYLSSIFTLATETLDAVVLEPLSWGQAKADMGEVSWYKNRPFQRSAFVLCYLAHVSLNPIPCMLF